MPLGEACKSVRGGGGAWVGPFLFICNRVYRIGRMSQYGGPGVVFDVFQIVVGPFAVLFYFYTRPVSLRAGPYRLGNRHRPEIGPFLAETHIFVGGYRFAGILEHVPYFH